MLIGFIHGVMNTDHTYIAGETIDYGPCAFMTQPRCSARSTDPAATPIATNRSLNLERFAETLLPLLAGGRGSGSCRLRWRQNRIARSLQLPVAYQSGLQRKIGFASAHEGDVALAQDLPGAWRRTAPTAP